MSTDPNLPPFARVSFRNDQYLVGARWWQESLATAANPVARRELLIALGAVGGVIAIGAFCGVVTNSSSFSSDDSNLSSDEEVKTRPSIEVQREQGWSFGTTTEPLTFDGESYSAFDRSSLDNMASDLMPTQKPLQPYYIQTLIQAVSAKPSSPDGPVEPVGPLRDALKPISTPGMSVAFGQGKGMSTLLEGAPPGRVLIVDLPGPEAVAFAAGLAEMAEPVLLFDNWPHPRGVVPSHLTLAALAYYAPLFKKAVSKRKPNAPAVFVLDRNRLASYSDETDRFDNRYMARVPPAENIKALGGKQVLYVGTNPEADDLNADFVAYAAAGLEMRTIAVSDFNLGAPPPGPASPASPGKPDAGVPTSTSSSDDYYYYGGSYDSHYFFWSDYGWGRSPRPTRGARPGGLSPASSYTAPVARTTMFNTAGAPKQRPSTFGQTMVIVNRGTGRVVGSTFSRSGSFGRSSGSWGG